MNTFIMGRDLLDIETLMILKATGSKKVEATATGNPLTFLTDIARPLKSLLIPFTPKQTGSGDPSPDNVRPITGWTGVTVNHAGKNLFLCFDDITFGKWINGSGVESNNSRGCITNEIQGEAGITYTFSFNGVSPLDFCVIELNASKTFIKRNRGTTDDQQTEITFTTDANTRYIKCECFTKGEDMSQAVLDSYKMQLEKGSTKTQYDNTATAYPVTWSSEGTVYGGYVDLVTGVLTVTHKILDTVWSAGETSGEFTNVLRKVFIFDDVLTGSNAKTRICNIAKYSVNYSSDTVHYYIETTGGHGVAYVFLPVDTLADTPVQVCEELVTPITIQLTPAQITALVGNNTIWSDADGSMTAIYLKKD